MSSRSEFEIVEVEWEDAFTEKEVALNSMKPETIWNSVGYLIKDEPSRVVLGISLMENEDSHDTLSIPRGMVREVRYLSRRRKSG